MNNNHDPEDDDFVFKTAISPKLNSEVVSNLISESSINLITEKLATSFIDSQVKPEIKVNIRMPILDAFIAEKKREMDAELAELSKKRLEEYIKREREAEEIKEQEFDMQLKSLTTNKNENNLTSEEQENEKQIAEEIDRKEEEMFKEMREKAKETWKELKEEYQAGLEKMYTEQSARLSNESQLQESLKVSGSVFDKDLFEKVVEKCGKGRESAYGKEKMSRFWEVLDRNYPNDNNGLFKSLHSKQDDDKLLASLLG